MELRTRIYATKIQRLYRKNRCIRIINDIKKLNIIDYSKNKTFDEFKKFILSRKINQLFTKFSNVVNNYKNISIKQRVIVIAYFIYLYPKDIISSNKHPYDYDIIVFAENLVRDIENENYNITNIITSLTNFNNIFSAWSTMDKNRLIEDCIKSYYFKCEHIDKIKTNELVRKKELHDKNQINEMLNELEIEKKDLLNNILSLDKTFDVKYFSNNYKMVYENIIKTQEEINKSIAKNMKLAYYDLLNSDLKQGNQLSTMNLIKEIGTRLAVLCPKANKNQFMEKFNDNNLTDILLECAFTDKLVKFIYFMFDFIMIIDAPVNDELNKNYRDTINEMTLKEYHVYFPRILIHLEEKIDEIYNLIIQADNNHSP